VRLFKRGDEISDEAKRRKLQREFRALADLKQYIFWSSVGREGAYHFVEELRQKKMAENLLESVASGVSVEKAQKMIKRCVHLTPIDHNSLHYPILQGCRDTAQGR